MKLYSIALLAIFSAKTFAQSVPGCINVTGTYACTEETTGEQEKATLTQSATHLLIDDGEEKQSYKFGNSTIPFDPSKYSVIEREMIKALGLDKDMTVKMNCDAKSIIMDTRMGEMAILKFVITPTSSGIKVTSTSDDGTQSKVCQKIN